MPNVSLTNYDSQLAELQRRQRMAELMQQEAMQPIQVGEYKGIKAPVTWTNGLAKIMQGLAGNYMGERARKEEGEVKGKQYAETLAALLGKQEINPVNVTPSRMGQEAVAPGAVQDTNAGPATSYTGGILPQGDAQKLGSVLSGLSPDVGTPIAGQMLAQAMKPTDLKDRYMNVSGVGLADLAAEGGPKAILKPSKLLTPEELAQQKDIRAAGRTTIQNNVGPTGIDYGDPEKGLTWKRDQNGKVMLDERGAPIGVPYQGGSVYREEREALQKKSDVLATRQLQSDIVVTDIDRALKIIEPKDSAVTGMASLLSAVPGTEAHNVSELLNTVKANAGFDKLQEMRNNSPTGGALGPVSDFENKLLQSTIGALAQSQTKDQLVYNLRRVKDIYSKIITEGINPDGSPRLKRQTTQPAAPSQGGKPTVSNW